ncbi:hypothetical protein AMK06_CH03360 [Rhizobium sp. N541]|uniref:DUF2958 domain-containing protein n=1 Tax=unclassified Rhizobium TaxID=2613769 RepID=UPI0007EE87A7|nr:MULTISPECIES: DUF2958 domain-containing protein [unclassified Rhizobium]ANM18234.1 hypothetical protein AMK06_CH03360 [Rhizobium sp. N541]ANM24620.1 hypothetical protein AMK07_CH03358 [Rhizobium sp. N941]
MHRYSEDETQTSQLSQTQIDLALLFMSDLHVNGRSLYRIQGGRPFWVRYEADGRIQERSYFSALSWRALMLFALEDCREFKVLEMDEPGRLAELFPEAIMRQLEENAKARRNFAPVLKLVDPKGSATVIVTRNRCNGHAVDILHNLNNGRPVFQAVWVSDLLRLDAKIGMRLVRDESFAPIMPIGAYIETAALLGQIAGEDEISILPLTGNVPRLRLPEPAATVQRIFDHQCRRYRALEQLRGRTIYEDYGFA